MRIPIRRRSHTAVSLQDAARPGITGACLQFCHVVKGTRRLDMCWYATYAYVCMSDSMSACIHRHSANVFTHLVADRMPGCDVRCFVCVGGWVRDMQVYVCLFMCVVVYMVCKCTCFEENAWHRYLQARCENLFACMRMHACTHSVYTEGRLHASNRCGIPAARGVPDTAGCLAVCGPTSE